MQAIDDQFLDIIYEFFYIIMFAFRLTYNYFRMQASHLNIKLTPIEQQVFDTLISYTRELQLNTVLRVAGGWVRDKIMGWESKDIDIALDNMKGEEFVLLLKKHAETKNEKISGFGVTKLNPDLSKHLETATAKIHNQPIDFVNLRSETYNNESRIPIIDIGTPLDDALRRDFTINSLFYNINTGEVEDYTERGLGDIQNQVIRTPLQPLVTFKDDPLRILRCFRFRARFNFTIHEDIYKSLQNQGVRQALRTKVSKERIGIELAGIIKAPFILSGLVQVYRYNFWNIIFEVPKESDLKDPHLIAKIPEYSYRLIEKGRQLIEKYKLLTEKSLLEIQGKQQKEKRVRYSGQEFKILINLSFLTVFYRNYKMAEGKKWTPLIDHIIRNQLKYSAKVAKFVTKMGELVNELDRVLKESTPQSKKIRIIKWLRAAEQKWEIAIFVLQVIKIIEFNQDGLAVLELRDYILNQGLEQAFLVESYIDGTFLIKKGKKGPVIKNILDNTILWRILNPSVERTEFLQLFDKNAEYFQSDKSYC